MGSSVVTAESLHTLECAPTSEDRALPACFLTVCHHLHEAKLEQVYFWGADVLTPWQIQPGLDEIRLHLLFALSLLGTLGKVGEGTRLKLPNSSYRQLAMLLKWGKITVPAQSTVSNINDSLKAVPEHHPQQ